MAKKSQSGDFMVRVPDDTRATLAELRKVMTDHDKANGRPNTEYSTGNLVDYAVRQLLGHLKHGKAVQK